MNKIARGLVIAAPTSGAGKTTLTLGLLRALRNGGKNPRSAKTGPDYIDPGFHSAATGAPCVNLDAFAMAKEQLRRLAAQACAASELLIIEGVMGLFDGALNGEGSTADLAATLDLPVVLVIDASKQGQSVAALAQGFRDHRSDIRLAGVILNRVGSPRHLAMLKTALEAIGLPVLGALPRAPELTLPERHLGLIQAREHPALEHFLETAATLIERNVDLEQVDALAAPIKTNPSIADEPPANRTMSTLPPLGQKIAIARDDAFAFLYPHVLNKWREAGAQLSFFSPLANETPPPDADAIYLPGGYPELHGAQLAQAQSFRQAMRRAAERNTLIFGECGGYMSLGAALIDAQGASHEMLNLLPLITSFAERKLHLGYRRLTPLISSEPDCSAFFSRPLIGHEFHYASIVSEDLTRADRLFAAADAVGASQGDIGLRQGKTMGSFAHIISIKVE